MNDVEPWAVKETRERIRGMSGSETVELMAELSDEALQLLIDSVKNESKGASPEEIRRQVNEALWKRDLWLTRKRSKK